MAKKKYSDEQIDQIRILIETGRTTGQIVKELGINYGVVDYYAKKCEKQKESQNELARFNADRHLCKTCAWRNKDRRANGGCDYCILHPSGKERPCSVEKCTVYEEGPIVREKSRYSLRGGW